MSERTPRSADGEELTQERWDEKFTWNDDDELEVRKGSDEDRARAEEYRRKNPPDRAP